MITSLAFFWALKRHNIYAMRVYPTSFSFQL